MRSSELLDDACLTSCGNGPKKHVQLTRATQFHGSGSSLLMWCYSLTSLSYQGNDETLRFLSPPGKGFLLQEDWPCWSAESSARGGGVRGGCHGLGVKPELSQGVEERHIRAAGEEGSREENKWDSGRCFWGPWMEVFFSKSRNGTACAVGQALL